MRVVLCYPVEDRHIESIQATVPDFEVVDAGQQRVAEELFDADIFCGHAKVPVPWPDIVSQGRLQWIQSSAAGLDHCLVPEVIDSTIQVTSASGLFADQVAEQTLALLLGLYRGLPTFFRAAQRREFVRRPTRDLHGKTVGIVGFGGNGRRIAEQLRGFRLRILATDWFPVHRPEFVERLNPPDGLASLLSESDIVILCVPLTPHTHHLIDAAALATMKPGAIVVNVARGPVIDETALIEALGTGHLGGAGLDVTEIEPLPQDSPLWDMESVLITPHVGAQSAHRVDDTTKFFCENLRRFQDGKELRNLVDKQLGFPAPSDIK